MTRRETSRVLIAIVLALAGCDKPRFEAEHGAAHAIEKPRLGLMTSLPLYWPEGTDFVDLASGVGEMPWQRRAVETEFDLIPLDTLSPMPGLAADDPETDPLADLDHLAVIQPRGLSPADNVALDNWVRSGGRLLLVLDPVLTGEYEFAIGDPRRPVDTALIPPVVERWGMTISFDEAQATDVAVVNYGEGLLLRALSGDVTLSESATENCQLYAGGMMAQCAIDKGRVTVLADAASFEIPPASLQAVEHSQLPVVAVPRFAFR